MKLSSVQSKDGISPAATTSTRKTKVTRFQLQSGLNATFVTALTIAILVIFLAPFAYMILTSLRIKFPSLARRSGQPGPRSMTTTAKR
jgi:hypothetical protein